MADQRKDDQQDRPEDQEGMGDNASTYEPTTPQVNNARVQGNGVGQKDIDYQRDPTRVQNIEQR